MGIEIILNERDGVSVWELLCQELHEVGVLFGSTLFVDFEPASSSVRFKGQQDATTTVFFILIVFALALTFAHGDGLQHIANEKAGSFIKT